MKDKIDHFLALLSNLIKYEADLIYAVFKWDDETKMAFRMTKAIFEEKDVDEI